MRVLLTTYGDRIIFVAPEAAFEEARKRLPEVIQRRNLPAEPFMEYFAFLATVVRTIEFTDYSGYEAVGWPGVMRTIGRVLAAALTLDCPIWTEASDFFGCGVATWISDRVELFLAGTDS